MTRSDPVSGSDVLRVMRWSMRVAMLGLLGVGIVRLVLVPDQVSWRFSTGLALSLAFVLIYLSGVRRSEERPESRANRWWLATLTSLWTLLLLLNPEFTWVSFPLFFSHMSLLRIRHALVAIMCMLLVSIAVLGHDRGLSAGVALGPTLGAVVAVLVSWGYRALVDESESRQRALDALRETRDELAASHREAGQLAERSRLAREIHDTLAQGLSSLVLTTRNARACLDRVSPTDDVETACALLLQAEHTASENLAEARRFVRGLTPRALASASLVDALERLIIERRERTPQIHWERRIDGTPRPLPTEVEVTLLRAAQASTENVLQHADASRVVVSVAFSDAEVTLDIADDGVGFDPDDAPGPDSFGIRGITERAEAVGGVCVVESSPGDGTVIGLRCPVPVADVPVADIPIAHVVEETP